MIPRGKLGRIQRANETRTARSPDLADMINAAAVRPHAAEVPAAKATRTAHKPRDVSAKSKPKPPETAPPRSPPPAPPPWWEDMLGWRGRGAPEARLFDDERYETIHDYDPMEWRLREDQDGA